MMDRGRERAPKPIAGVVYGLAGVSVTALIVGLAAFASPQPADALPAYAKQTGLSCGRCHVNPAGGGARTAFGNAFAANGHKVPAKGAKPGKTSAGEGPSPAAAPVAAPATGRALDYVPWTFPDPYYSHFLYSPDDYRN